MMNDSYFHKVPRKANSICILFLHIRIGYNPEKKFPEFLSLILVPYRRRQRSRGSGLYPDGLLGHMLWGGGSGGETGGAGIGANTLGKAS